MKKITLLLSIAVATTLLFTTNACKKSENNTTLAPTIYDSLGGTTMVTDPRGGTIETGRLGIRLVVDSTILVIAGDNKLNGFFPVLLSEYTATPQVLTGFFALEKNLTDFFCVALGAKNFTYSGKNMIDAHDPAKNNRMNGKAANADFDQFITDLVKGAQQNKVPLNLIQSIGKVVETTRTQVVQR